MPEVAGYGKAWYGAGGINMEGIGKNDVRTAMITWYWINTYWYLNNKSRAYDRVTGLACFALHGAIFGYAPMKMIEQDAVASLIFLIIYFLANVALGIWLYYPLRAWYDRKW